MSRLSEIKRPRLQSKVVTNAEELMQVFAIRSAVYMAEQRCPYEEEFDGNDYTGTHILGLVDNRPAACVRVRWFAGFAKGERMTVLRPYRGSGIVNHVLDKAFDLAQRKGYRRFYVHAQRRLVNHWTKFGLRPKSNQIFHFSDHEYIAMVRDLPELEDEAITEDTDPMVLLRSEDDFDSPGILEQSTEREPTNPVG